jgi:hypothetical protein
MKVVKQVWDLTGRKLFNFEGHEAPVYNICPHHKENIQVSQMEAEGSTVFLLTFLFSLLPGNQIKLSFFFFFFFVIDDLVPWNDGCVISMHTNHFQNPFFHVDASLSSTHLY